MENKKIIRLPKKGKLIVVTDIHGNINDFHQYTRYIWNRYDPNCHIIFTGDLIHELKYDEDFSIQILNEVDRLLDKYDNFHVLLGNHELTQIMGEDIYKWGTNQVEDFYKHIKDLYPDDEIEYANEHYLTILNRFSYCCITDNGFFISHAGISPNQTLQLINKEVDLYNLDIFNNIVDYDFFSEMIWARPYDDYVEKDIQAFLDNVHCKFMIVGHTPMNGLHILGNQLIMDSSFCTDTKYYLEIDLEEDYDDIIEDVLKLTEVIE